MPLFVVEYCLNGDYTADAEMPVEAKTVKAALLAAFLEIVKQNDTTDIHITRVTKEE
jgi:hypothetical protein